MISKLFEKYGTTLFRFVSRHFCVMHVWKHKINIRLPANIQSTLRWLKHICVVFQHKKVRGLILLYIQLTKIFGVITLFADDVA